MGYLLDKAKEAMDEFVKAEAAKMTVNAAETLAKAKALEDTLQEKARTTADLIVADLIRRIKLDGLSATTTWKGELDTLKRLKRIFDEEGFSSNICSDIFDRDSSSHDYIVVWLPRHKQ